MIKNADSIGLFLTRLTKVKPKSQKEANRYLLEFSKIKQELIKTSLTIFDESGNQFSASYKRLTKDFYLNF